MKGIIAVIAVDFGVATSVRNPIVSRIAVDCSVTSAIRMVTARMVTALIFDSIFAAARVNLYPFIAVVNIISLRAADIFAPMPSPLTSLLVQFSILKLPFDRSVTE